nr:hypothetical protein, expressed [Toxoplasma gondii RH]
MHWFVLFMFSLYDPASGSRFILPLRSSSLSFLPSMLSSESFVRVLCVSSMSAQIPGLPFHFDLALPKQRIVFLLGSHCASMPLTDDTDAFDPLSCISGLEPDLVSAVPTLPLVVQRRETNADGITGGKGDASGKTRDFNWELSECVVGSPRSGMNEIGEQKQKFRDAGSCGGRRLIRRLTEKAGYRLIEVEAPDAAQLDAALTRILQVGDHLS